MLRPCGRSAPQRTLLVALAFFLLHPALGLVEAQQQQQQPRAASAARGADAVHPPAVPRAARYASPAEAESFLAGQLTVETPQLQSKRTMTDDEHGGEGGGIHGGGGRGIGGGGGWHIGRQGRAPTAAPDDMSVRAPSPAYRDVAAAGSGQRLASPQHVARSLAEWEVEDFVLLATVDGDLVALDRKTGKRLWHIESDRAVVETRHHRANVSGVEPSFQPLDHWVWAVEPTGSGALYVAVPGSDGLAATGLSMKWLVEQGPYHDPDHPIRFTGGKTTTLVTLDAATGRVDKWFDGESGGDGSTAHGAAGADSCLRPRDFDEAASDECAVGGALTLGRTDYTVYVRRNSDGLTVATLRYSEWGPNNYDKDLHQQHKAPRDRRYVSGRPNGDVYGFRYDPVVDGVGLAFSHRLPAPVARVFDIARPPHVPPSSHPDLAVLPQPPPPAEDEETDRRRRANVFLNQTRDGSWFALSGAAYPLILDVPAAPCAAPGWWERHTTDDVVEDPVRLATALAGRHHLLTAHDSAAPLHHATPYLALPGPDVSTTVDGTEDTFAMDNAAEAIRTLPEAVTEPSPYVIAKVKELPQVAATRVVDLLTNPVLMIVMIVLLFIYQTELRRFYRRKKHAWFAGEDETKGEDREEEKEETEKEETEKEETEDKEEKVDKLEKKLEKDKMEVDKAVEGTPTEPTETDEASEAADGQKEKKKAHRGRRGGAKHRKGKKAETSQSRGDNELATVDEVVGLAKELGTEKRAAMEPDILTVPSDVQEVSGPILRMGSLEVNEDQQLGTGSNGTIVFAGKFDGRDVAVKRMLVQFYDIASQETKLLKESDDHPNVIRYFAQQQRAAFHYIALELCEASLADVIEKPAAFRALAQVGERNMQSVLYQITSGLNHLHDRHIVHRDLKPQNILVSMGADGRPRLLISDFGLCKKLEGGKSSFGATTAHAAGTSGWRAPELLLDDDARETGTTLVEAALSTHSGGGGASGVSGDGLAGGAPGLRRATKAIDVFGLGLVFYYVLSRGAHPFDCGDRYMREVNIRKGRYSLDALDALGDAAPEARDLVGRMLAANPRERPRARAVLAHPFFWAAKKRLAFLCDVSDHLEKEVRDPPSAALRRLEARAPDACEGDFLRHLPKDFVDSLGRQRKYTGTRLLDLLRALRNKRNHYEDLSEPLRRLVGALPDGYLAFWTVRFPRLLLSCWQLGVEEDWAATDRFGEYYRPDKE